MTQRAADFVQALLDPRAPVPEGLINPDGSASTHRFNVYRNNVICSLTEALATGFPAIHKLLGADNFRGVAGAFVRRHPPRSALMMHYGSEFPAFLADFVPLRAYPYLPDLARLELARRESYHAADVTAIDASTLLLWPEERLLAARLEFAPAVRLIRSRWPVLEIWTGLAENGPTPGSSGQNVLVARPEFDPMLTALPPGGGVFVSSLMGGEMLGAALGATQLAIAEFDLVAVLGILFSAGAITYAKEE